MIKQAYQAGCQAALQKHAVSEQYMRDYERANLDAGATRGDSAVIGTLGSLAGGYLGASTGGSTRSKVIRGALGALPGIALGLGMERARLNSYDRLENMNYDELKEQYTHNKAILDSLGFSPHGFLLREKRAEDYSSVPGVAALGGSLGFVGSSRAHLDALDKIQQNAVAAFNARNHPNMYRELKRAQPGLQANLARASSKARYLRNIGGGALLAGGLLAAGKYLDSRK
jgi:hypothetical protein